MIYSEDLRKEVMDYLAQGYSQRQASRMFNICTPTINKWSQRYRKTGILNDHPPRRSFQKIHEPELIAYIREHPAAYLREIADAFHCSQMAAHKALKRYGITRQKRSRRNQEKEIGK